MENSTNYIVFYNYIIRKKREEPNQQII